MDGAPSPAAATTAGSGNDLAVAVHNPTDHITTARGSFDVDNFHVTSIGSPVVNATSQSPNAFTLQLNTNRFRDTTIGCPGTNHPGCSVWLQFVYANNTIGSSTSHPGKLSVQYWLVNTNPTHPCSDWAQPTGVSTWAGFDQNNACYTQFNAAGADAGITLANLPQTRLEGTVSSNGQAIAALYVNGTAHAQVQPTNAFLARAAANWSATDFNVLGVYPGSKATLTGSGTGAPFNNKATIGVRTEVLDPQVNIDCLAAIPQTATSYNGSAGETNNLGFIQQSMVPANPPLRRGITVNLQESRTGPASCGLAAIVGDTHLTTQNGLHYDFQAAGDFLMASLPQYDMEIRDRQVPLDRWPNATLDTGTSVRVGADKVVVCANDKLFVDGSSVTDLPATAGDLTVSGDGQPYYVSDKNGNVVRIYDRGPYLDVLLGLGRWPTEMSGLLASSVQNPSEVSSKGGTAVDLAAQPGQLYDPYGNSWSVGPDADLDVCGGNGTAKFPSERFPLDAAARGAALDTSAAANICRNVGVGTEGKSPVIPENLVDACTMDVLVFGPDAAAVYLQLPEPRYVIKAGT
jgi:hypothetical protein